MRQITLEEAVDWVIMNRTGKAFTGYTGQQIEWAISRAINCGGFAFTLDEHGRLVGMVLCTPNRVERTLRVHNILTLKRGALRSMIERFTELFSDYTIVAKRHGREVVYRKTKRLVKLLCK